MKKKNAGNRSNYSLMPFDVRFKICTLLHDGATAEVVAREPEVSAAYERLGIKLNRSAVMRIKRCAEYKHICAKLEAGRLKEENDRLATAILRDTRCAETIAEQAKVVLLQAVSDIADLPEMSDEARVKALRSLTQSVTALSSQEKDRKIAELHRKLESKEAQLRASEEEWKAREAELEYQLAEKERRIAELEKQVPGVDSGKVAGCNGCKIRSLIMGYFLPYQQRWINDDAPLKLYEKSRRTGITYATSYRAVRKCLREPEKSSFVQWVSSRDTLTAKEFVTDYVAMWCREANAVARGLQGDNVEVVDEQHGITAFVVRFKNGARICSLSSNPMAFAGKGGDVLIDEMDLHEDQETLYAMAYPCITWGGQLEIVSAYSADGSENTQFAQLCKEAKGENPKGFSFHRTTLDDAIAEGFVEKINESKRRKGRPEQSREEFREMIRRGCINQDAFASQYLCIPNQASGQQAVAPGDLAAAKKDFEILRVHLTGDGTVLDLVDPCAEAYTHREYWRDLAELWKLERPAVGWDIAVTGDLACIWINTRTADDVYRLAVCLTFKGCKVESQRRVMEAIFEALPYAVGAGDASGLGTSDCAKLEALFYGRFAGAKFTAPFKLTMYTTLQGVYEARRQLLPAGRPEIAADVAAMRKSASMAERLIFTAGRNELLPDSHCDLMTANALAVWAGETIGNAGPCFMAPVERKPQRLESEWEFMNRRRGYDF